MVLQHIHYEHYWALIIIINHYKVFVFVIIKGYHNREGYGIGFSWNARRAVEIQANIIIAILEVVQAITS